MLNHKTALALTLGELAEPVVTLYRLGVIIFSLCSEKKIQGEELESMGKAHAELADLQDAIEYLRSTGILKSHINFPNKVFRILGRKDSAPEEIACTIDPFCYVSHLSAMSYHGLTNRLPVEMILSGPDSGKWGELADSQMSKDLGDELDTYRDEGMPLLTRTKFSKIGKTKIHRINSSRLGAFKNIRDRSMRVSTIGRTFLDMLQSPQLCGGMRHVIEVFTEHAATYLMPIVYEVDQYGGPIDKVRAGYLLDELLGIGNETIEKWAQFASRGGSRKLDPAEEYFPKWSEKWCISLNIDLPEDS